MDLTVGNMLTLVDALKREEEYSRQKQEHLQEINRLLKEIRNRSNSVQIGQIKQRLAKIEEIDNAEL